MQVAIEIEPLGKTHFLPPLPHPFLLSSNEGNLQSLSSSYRANGFHYVAVNSWEAIKKMAAVTAAPVTAAVAVAVAEEGEEEMGPKDLRWGPHGLPLLAVFLIGG
nr:hypothetical protein Iba_chr08bCG13290 [Ipomoea batatas]GMD27601.1 hypothetical protein Iba_chr08dCG15270 [Ipomoea batatas]